MEQIEEKLDGIKTFRLHGQNGICQISALSDDFLY